MSKLPSNSRMAAGNGIITPENPLNSPGVSNTQGYNTFENIKYNCKTLDDLKNLKKCFRKANYPKEILKILLDEIEKKKAELSK